MINTKIETLKPDEITPFFSVCVDLYNRAETIERVLESICLQSCKDFELLVVDNGSTDNSVELSREILKKYPSINAKLFIEGKKNNQIQSWNSPIIKAVGKYIAICEGDDYYHPDHLKDAKIILNSINNVGLYIAGSKLSVFEKNYQVLTAEAKSRELKMLKWCPAPSSTIFLRLSSQNNRFVYDENFKWAGEYSLYHQILKSNYKVIENYTKNYIERGFRFYLKNDFHMYDLLKFRHGRYYDYDSYESLLVDRVIYRQAIFLFAFNLIFLRLNRNLLYIASQHFKLSRINLMLGINSFWGGMFSAVKQHLRNLN